MSQENLLKIISEESQRNGYADAKVVESRYGIAFSDTLMALFQRGHISREGPMGSIGLTASGHGAAAAATGRSGPTGAQLSLLRVIAEEAQRNGYADAKVVESRYGNGFADTFRSLYQRGYISNEGPMGTISLSYAGHAGAEG